jgi:DNA-binding response OmpR family regulator
MRTAAGVGREEVAMAKGRILLVLSDPELLASVGRELRSAGYEVLAARHGDHAVQRAHRTPPDVIILDFVSPSRRGHSLAVRLRDDTATAAIPIVYLAERASEVDCDRARKLGVAKLIDLPCEPAVLAAAIDDLVEKKRGRAGEA